MQTGKAAVSFSHQLSAGFAQASLFFCHHEHSEGSLLVRGGKVLVSGSFFLLLRSAVPGAKKLQVTRLLPRIGGLVAQDDTQEVAPR